MANQHGPKLPAKQLAILAVARFAEPLAMTSVFPYLPEMIASFGVEKRDVAKWAGATSAVFSLAQSVTAVPWGRASDRFGRKPVIMTGLLCTMACFLVWGMSSSLPMAITVRAIQGASNGNVGIIRTMVAEMVPERELQPRAFSIMPLVWSIGSIFGPAFGGFFAKPADQFPSLFGDSEFFKAYPFLLPNILGSIIFLISMTTGILFLKETLASKRHTRDWGLVLGDRITETLSRRKHYRTRRYSFQDDEASAPLLRTDASHKTFSERVNKPSSTAPPSYKSVFTRQSVINLIAYTFLALHSVAYDQVLPVFLNYPRDEHDPADFRLPFVFTGGFGLNSGSIGTIFTVYGIICGLIQFLVFPPLCTHFGVLRCLKACAVTFPIVYIITPFTTLIEDERTRLAALLAIMCFKAFCVIIGFPCTTILLTNSAASLNKLGTLNGFATTFSALGRASGPAMAGGSFSWGVRRGIVSNIHFYLTLSNQGTSRISPLLIAIPWWLLAVIAAIGAVPVWWIEEGQGPSASASSANSPSELDVDSEETAIEDDDEEPEPPKPRAIVFADESDELNAREHDFVIHDPTGRDDLPLVGSMRSMSGMDYEGMTRRESMPKKSQPGYGSFKN
ncbi:putative Major facilitator superfamily (MFS) profile domain-containing protein [Seiridium cardinale]|uniref:Major facilitator superfamily (MFS) profile domain-containing protein n=1 Tax=Seiridium cardinale TaxID=138064 RepID=A0ABR2XUB0_9PEZI